MKSKKDKEQWYCLINWCPSVCICFELMVVLFAVTYSSVWIKSKGNNSIVIAKLFKSS